MKPLGIANGVTDLIKFMGQDTTTIDEKIKALQKMLATCPTHK